jgi:hypothetical protein
LCCPIPTHPDGSKQLIGIHKLGIEKGVGIVQPKDQGDKELAIPPPPLHERMAKPQNTQTEMDIVAALAPYRHFASLVQSIKLLIVALCILQATNEQL